MTTEIPYFKPCTVLLVEDNPEHVELAIYALQKAGESAFQVEHVDQLTTALDRLARGGIDVALVDLLLPDSSGMDTFQAIRAAAPGVPIVVLTDTEDEKLALEMLRQGAQDYLLKHEVELGHLGRSLHFAIERQRNAALEESIHKLDATQALLQRKNRKMAKLYRTAHKFVDNVSHEFRTPLTVIMEYASLVREGLVGAVSDEQQRLLTVVEDRADDLNTIVNDMLDVSKLKSGQLGIRRRECQVGEILDHVRLGIERKAAVKEVELEFEIDPILPTVFCDPRKAGRVLINLAVNAIMFCGHPGRVRLSCRRETDGGGVKLSVSDNGNGIDPENLETIFRRFKQLGESTRSSTKGFGLGLSIAKQLVELNLGDITVESRIGRGSTFFFTLPPAEPREVLRRYLKWIERRRNGSTQLVMLQADVDESTSATLADDGNLFLNHLLSSTDLLFRNRPTQWLVVLRVPEKEVADFRQRIEKKIGEANRDRLGEPLPDIRLKFLGAWHVRSDRDDLQSRLAFALKPAKFGSVCGRIPVHAE